MALLRADSVPLVRDNILSFFSSFSFSFTCIYEIIAEEEFVRRRVFLKLALEIVRDNSFSIAVRSSIESRESDRGINRDSLPIFFVRLFRPPRESRTFLSRIVFLFINLCNRVSSFRVIVYEDVRFSSKYSLHSLRHIASHRMRLT
jgi:hypothetical protein